MMYDQLNTGIGSLSPSREMISPFDLFGPGREPLPSEPIIGPYPSTSEPLLPFGPGTEPLPSEPITAPYPSPFGPGVMPLLPGPYGGGTQGGIMDALNPHKNALYEDYNPKKVDRFYKRVEQMSNRFFPGYTGSGPQKIY